MSDLKQAVKKVIKAVILILYRLETIIFPVDPKVIIFESNLGRNYTGNPRCIYEEMVRQGLDQKYKCYVILEDTSTEVPGHAVKIKRARLKYFYVLSRTAFIVSDSRMPKFVIKRKKTTYIQTWHGTPLKKLALDMDDVSMAGEKDITTYKYNFAKNAAQWDYLISQNAFSTKTFRQCFAFYKEMLEIGYPRNDILFKKNNLKDITALKQKLGLPLDKKVILYAPTWRDDEFYGKGKYKFTSKLDFKRVYEALGDEYVFIVKYHYLVQDKINWSEYKGFIYQYDMTYDISLLYLVSDMMITDYSSVMFDYSLLRRPMLFYAYDLDNYKNKLRGFYFDLLEEAPGPVCTTTEELIQYIKNYDSSVYEEKYLFDLDGAVFVCHHQCHLLCPPADPRWGQRGRKAENP